MPSRSICGRDWSRNPEITHRSGNRLKPFVPESYILFYSSPYLSISQPWSSWIHQSPQEFPSIFTGNPFASWPFPSTTSSSPHLSKRKCWNLPFFSSRGLNWESYIIFIRLFFLTAYRCRLFRDFLWLSDRFWEKVCDFYGLSILQIWVNVHTVWIYSRFRYTSDFYIDKKVQIFNLDRRLSNVLFSSLSIFLYLLKFLLNSLFLL